MITADLVDRIIFGALEALNAERRSDGKINLSPETHLFGVEAELDSLEFVSVITDVETALNLDCGLDISLADDRAMGRTQSPYSTVRALRDFILELTEEA